MNKKLIFILFSLILLLFSINIPAVAEPITEEHDNFIVTWYEISQYPFVYDISIQNLLPEKRDINITSIFDSTSFSINDLEVVGFYEWKNISYIVTVVEYGWDNNETHQWKIETGSHNETRYKLAWKVCKMQSFKRTATQYKENMGEINIPKFGSKPKDGTDNGTKWFRIKFNMPMARCGEGWGSSGRIALDLSGAEFDPWWDVNWLYRRQIDIDNSASTETFDNFTVRISLTSSNIDWTHVQDDLDDLRFTDSDEVTLLDAELENHAVNDWAEIWVRIPSLTSGGTYSIFIYYGNVGASSAWDEPNTWDDDYEGVWHFDETSGDVIDSLGNFDLTPQGSPTQDTTLIIDGADYGPGSGTRFDRADDPALEAGTDPFTLIALVNLTDTTTATGYIIGKVTPASDYPLYGLDSLDVSGLPNTYWRTTGAAYTIVTGTTSLHDKVSFVAAVRQTSDDKIYLYVNGTSDATPLTDNSGDIQTTGVFSVFDRSVQGYNAKGFVDEIRIYRGQLSAEWMEAENKNLFSTWLTYHAEEEAIVTTTILHSTTVTSYYSTTVFTTDSGYYQSATTEYETTTEGDTATTTVYSTTTFGETLVSVDVTLTVSLDESLSIDFAEYLKGASAGLIAGGLVTWAIILGSAGLLIIILFWRRKRR